MVAALRCVRPQFQWYQLAYATEMKPIQLHDSIEGLSQKIVSIILHYITITNHLFEVWKFISVSGRYCYDFRPRFEILGDGASVASVFIHPDELRDLVVGVEDVDDEPRVVVQRVCRSVLENHPECHLASDGNTI